MPDYQMYIPGRRVRWNANDKARVAQDIISGKLSIERALIECTASIEELQGWIQAWQDTGLSKVPAAEVKTLTAKALIAKVHKPRAFSPFKKKFRRGFTGTDSVLSDDVRELLRELLRDEP